MLDLPGLGSRFLFAFFVVSCSSEDPSQKTDDVDTGTPTATNGAGSGTVTANTSGASQTASTSAGPTSVGAGATTDGDAGGSGGSGGSGDGPSTTGGPGSMGFGFGFGAGGTSGDDGSGGSGDSSGGETSTAATTATTGAGGCTPAVDCEPEALESTGDPYQDCVDRINQFRVGCWCLPPLERWVEGEACANEHAQYDSEQDEAHAGFSDRICDNGGNAQNECPGWRSETQIIQGCLQMMYDEGPPPSEQCNGQCFQEHGHFINMTNDNYTRVACGFYTTPGGEVWSVQNFR